MITILKQCEREIQEFPEEIREDLADALARLERGLMLFISFISTDAKYWISYS